MKELEHFFGMQCNHESVCGRVKNPNLKGKDNEVYGYTKNQRCKRLLLDPQGMVQKLSYRITLHGKCQPNCIIRDAETEKERDEETKQKPRKEGV